MRAAACRGPLATWRRRTIAAVALMWSLALSACASVEPYVPDDQHHRFTREEARACVVRALEEQPEKFRPLTVDVGEDALRLGVPFNQRSIVAGGISTVVGSETYYYTNLAAFEIVEKRGRWRIHLSNKDETVRRWVFFNDRQRAIDFLDALTSLASPGR